MKRIKTYSLETLKMQVTCILPQSWSNDLGKRDLNITVSYQMVQKIQLSNTGKIMLFYPCNFDLDPMTLVLKHYLHSDLLTYYINEVNVNGFKGYGFETMKNHVVIVHVCDKVFVWPPRSWSSQGQGHCKFKVIPESSCKCLDFYHEAGGGPSTKRHSCLMNVTMILTQ